LQIRSAPARFFFRAQLPHIATRPHAANANRHLARRQANPPSTALALPSITASRIARITPLQELLRRRYATVRPQRSPQSALNSAAKAHD
jgi:hypothetical protein